MRSYLSHTFDEDDPELISVIDDLSLWSAPFGLELLDTVRLRPGMKLLDVGTGLGFPLIELAQRIGPAAHAVGLDPWKAALDRARLKIRTYGLINVDVVEGVAENMPFETESFDLIVSNNGINNVTDIAQSFAECRRVAKPGAQFVMTYNLEATMREFYDLFESALAHCGLSDRVESLRAHIYKKRKPLGEMNRHLKQAGFAIRRITEKSFKLRFAGAEAMFSHALIKYWFLGPWKELIEPADVERVFEDLERRIDSVAAERGEFALTVPYATIDAERV